MATNTPHPAFEGYAEEDVPQAAVGSPGKEGLLELTFASQDGGTALVHDFARVPFHLSGSLDHNDPDDATTVYVQSPTGGIAQGDRHTVDIQAKPGATALVSTQSATKVQRMKHNYASASMDLRAETGAHLAYVPEQTILHRDSRFQQTVDIDLADDATVVFGDIVVPGRLARDERFDFERYYQRVSASGPDGLLFEDTTHLVPESVDPDRVGLLGGSTVYGTLYVVTTTDCDAQALSDDIHEAMDGCRASATRLPNDSGVVVRALADQTEAVTDALHTAWAESRETLLGVGPAKLRKY